MPLSDTLWEIQHSCLNTERPGQVLLLSAPRHRLASSHNLIKRVQAGAGYQLGANTAYSKDMAWSPSVRPTQMLPWDLPKALTRKRIDQWL